MSQDSTHKMINIVYYLQWNKQLQGRSWNPVEQGDGSDRYYWYDDNINVFCFFLSYSLGGLSQEYCPRRFQDVDTVEAGKWLEGKEHEETLESRKGRTWGTRGAQVSCRTKRDKVSQFHTREQIGQKHKYRVALVMIQRRVEPVCILM